MQNGLSDRDAVWGRLLWALRFLKWDPDPQREATIIWVFAWDKIRMSAEVDAITKAGLQHQCGPLQITLDIFVVFHSV